MLFLKLTSLSFRVRAKELFAKKAAIKAKEK